jgi:hypothetical protein
MGNFKAELTKLGNSSEFEIVQDLLYTERKLEEREAEFLFSIAQILIKKHEYDLKMGKSNSSIYVDYAYSIIARTCFKINDFIALYDFAVNYGYYPIAKKITALNLIEQKSVNFLLTDIGMEEFRVNDIVLTSEQKQSIYDVINSESKKIGFIAPTSYGKSESIFEHLKNNDFCDVVSIIVPTKALINQVFRDAKKIIKDRKFIIHDQDFDIEKDMRILAIITQERAVRMQTDGIVFDLLYIDEAHELLKFDFRKKFNNRALVLTRLIRIARQKNPNLIEVYLSPMLDTVDNLCISESGQEFSYSIQEIKIKKDLKILDIRYVNSEKECLIYDRFVNKFILLKKECFINKYITTNSRKKNLHFLYRPKFIESYAEDLYKWLNESSEMKNDIPNEILQLISEIKRVVHPDYKVAKFLKAGIVYLHGKLPNLIRNYLLKFVRESEYIKHFVANSVILAGMNLPIDNLFYIAGDSNINDMNNLIGRANRLNEIFSSKNTDLKKMFIPIHFLEIKEYPQRSNGNLKDKIEKLRNKVTDLIKNPLLLNYKVNDNNKDMADKIIKFENDVVSTFDNPTDEAKLLRAGAQQILNFSEEGTKKLISKIKNWNMEIEMDKFLFAIKEIFFDEFKENYDFEPEHNVKRLNNIKIIEYYDSFIKGRRIYPFPMRVDYLVKNWLSSENAFVYIGPQYGEVSFETNVYRKPNKVYVKLDDHLNDIEYLNNLAVIKLQIDDEFVEYEIMLLLNTLKEFKIISQDNLDLYFFGTNDKKELKLLKRGISHSMFNKIKEQNLIDEITFDEYDNPIVNNKLREFIDEQTGIEKFELNEFFI